MRSKFLPLVLLVIIASASMVLATDLRGRVDGFNSYSGGTRPLPGVGIGLFLPTPNGGFVFVRQAVTGPDGMYYLRGVYPGQYVLQVGGVNYPLGVGAMAFQDIPAILR